MLDRVALGERLDLMRAEIAQAARDTGRSPDELTLIVVTKFHPPELIQALVDLGVRDIGENRHQEAAAKHDLLSELNVTWHFIGQLQSKKARQVARYADVIHSIDRAALVEALAPIDRTIDCFLQVNLTDDPNRGGVAPGDLIALAEQVAATPTLKLLGVMAVAPLDEAPETAFERLRGYSELVQTVEPSATSISAGMTQDFREAIAAGATHLRIGSAITGNRPAAG